MSPDGLRRVPVDKEALGQALVAGLTTVPGVRRLEPRLGSRLRGRATGGVVTSLPVRLRSAAEATIADLDVDLATDATRPAVQVADAVQRRAGEIVAAHGLQVGWVQVSVLSVEP